MPCQIFPVGQFLKSCWVKDSFQQEFIVEYDEPYHYVDIENDILIDKDIERQNYIIQNLKCQFYRYNEKTKTLWKVN